MKKRILQLMLFASIYTNASAQTPANCPPNTNAPIAEYCEHGHGISTNPDNLVNDDCPDLKNDFEWRVKHSPTPLPPGEWFPIYNGSTRYDVRNPFNTDISSLDYSYLAANHGSNYHPEDGWELLKMDFGMLSNIGLPYSTDPGRNTAIPAPKLPYFILYNKYSGTFRFFGTLLGQMEGYETIEIELRIPKLSPGAEPNDRTTNVYQDDLKATNLLSIAGEAVQPLDQETDENVMVVFAKATNDEETFFWFDIPVAYDPCLCNIRSQLDITFSFVQTANLKLNGSSEDGINTKTEPLTQKQYAKKMTANVLAVAVSKLVAVKTGGTVVNFQAYANFVNLLANKPNSKLSPKQLEDLKKLGGYLDCGAKFGKVIQGNYSDVIGKDNKKAIKAGNNILDANTTFLSSLGNGCSKKDNAATTITGAMELTGTWTKKDAIPSTEIKLAMPGSNWTDKTMGIVSYSESNGKRVPAYPTYNERLGTFALLETPEVNIVQYFETKSDNIQSRYGGIFMLTRKVITKLSLEEDLKFTFNPAMNLNMDETEIYCRFVVKESKNFSYSQNSQILINGSGRVFDLSPLPRDRVIRRIAIPNSNIVHVPDSKYPIATHFVPINQFKKMTGLFNSRISPDYYGNLNELYENNIQLQIKVIAKSYDVGKSGNNQSVFTYTYPVKVNRGSGSGILPPNLFFPRGGISHPTFEEMESFIDLTYIPMIKEHFYNGIIRLDNSDKNFNNDLGFTNSDILAYDGIVTISAKLSTSPGQKVKIYSTMGFEIERGGEIGPDIELIVGYPFQTVPQPPQTYAQVADFCSDNSRYKAQEFSTAAVIREQEEYDRRAKQREEEIKKELARFFMNCTISPNPNTGSFVVNFDRQLVDVALLTVTDLTGRSVHMESLGSGQSKFNINTHNLTPGVYFVTVQQGAQKQTFKIMIQN